MVKLSLNLDVDLTELRDQKQAILQSRRGHLDGMLSLIDAIQTHARSQGISDFEVYGATEMES
jgi:hypothetical protein